MQTSCEDTSTVWCRGEVGSAVVRAQKGCMPRESVHLLLAVCSTSRLAGTAHWRYGTRSTTKVGVHVCVCVCVSACVCIHVFLRVFRCFLNTCVHPLSVCLCVHPFLICTVLYIAPAVAGDDKEGSSDVLQAEESTPGTSTPRPGPKALLFPRDTAEELAPARAEE